MTDPKFQHNTDVTPSVGTSARPRHEFVCAGVEREPQARGNDGARRALRTGRTSPQRLEMQRRRRQRRDAQGAAAGLREPLPRVARMDRACDAAPQAGVVRGAGCHPSDVSVSQGPKGRARAESRSPHWKGGCGGRDRRGWGGSLSQGLRFVPCFFCSDLKRKEGGPCAFALCCAGRLSFTVGGASFPKTPPGGWRVRWGPSGCWRRRASRGGLRGRLRVSEKKGDSELHPRRARDKGLWSPGRWGAGLLFPDWTSAVSGPRGP